MTTTPSEILTVEQFAERLQVSRTTVFAWIKTGIITEGVHYCRLGRTLRFTWDPSTLFTQSRSDDSWLGQRHRAEAGGRHECGGRKHVSAPVPNEEDNDHPTRPVINLDY